MALGCAHHLACKFVFRCRFQLLFSFNNFEVERVWIAIGFQRAFNTYRVISRPFQIGGKPWKLSPKAPHVEQRPPLPCGCVQLGRSLQGQPYHRIYLLHDLRPQQSLALYVVAPGISERAVVSLPPPSTYPAFPAASGWTSHKLLRMLHFLSHRLNPLSSIAACHMPVMFAACFLSGDVKTAPQPSTLMQKHTSAPLPFAARRCTSSLDSGQANKGFRMTCTGYQHAVSLLRS